MSLEIRELPVFWGNNIWIEKDGIISKREPLTPDDPRWIDYRQVSLRGTSLLAEKGHPEAQFRKALQTQIVKKILGINPRGEEDKSLPHCVLTHGGIASGKTSAMNIYLEAMQRSAVNFLRVDFDLIKQELPEYQFMRIQGIAEAAMHTQSESAKLAGRILKRAISQLYHLIYEGSLADISTIRQRIGEMRKKNFFITIVSTFVPAEIGLARAKIRYEQGGRFVPPDRVLQSYIGCGQNLRALADLADHLILIDNVDHEKGALIAQVEGGKTEIINKSLYTRYKQNVPEGGWLD